MKIINTLVLVVLATVSFGSVTLASDVALPHTFVSGTKAKAAEVNNNFNAVKTAVDDNNSRVNALEEQTSGLENGCPPGFSIRQIASNGTITCEEDTDTDTDTLYFPGTGLSLSGQTFQVAPGVISVAAHAFENENTSIDQVTDCILRKGAGVGYAYYLAIAGATAASCDPVTGVNLPDDVVLTGLFCTVWDNFDGNAMRGDLYRVNLVLGTTQTIFSTPNSVDLSDEQVVSDTVPETGRQFVNNATYAYVLVINYTTNDFSTLGVLGRFYGCRITYTP